MLKVFINPGHAPNGKPDPGASNEITGLRECDVALIIGNKVANYLKAVGYATKVLQSNSLEEIVDSANNWTANVFVSIHCNAANTAAQGTENWYWYSSGEGPKLAEFIQNQIIKSIKTVDRGTKQAGPDKDRLYVLRYTDMPAVLVEMAFIDNASDVKLLSDPKMQDEFARAIARGVTDYFANLK